MVRLWTIRPSLWSARVTAAPLSAVSSRGVNDRSWASTVSAAARAALDALGRRWARRRSHAWRGGARRPSGVGGARRPCGGLGATLGAADAAALGRRGWRARRLGADAGAALRSRAGASRPRVHDGRGPAQRSATTITVAATSASRRTRATPACIVTDPPCSGSRDASTHDDLPAECAMLRAGRRPRRWRLGTRPQRRGSRHESTDRRITRSQPPWRPRARPEPCPPSIGSRLTPVSHPTAAPS